MRTHKSVEHGGSYDQKGATAKAHYSSRKRSYLIPVSGLVSFEVSHSSIAPRSKVCPSHVHTGSVITCIQKQQDCGCQLRKVNAFVVSRGLKTVLLF